MNLKHVLLDHLERKVFLALEMMVEGTLRGARRCQQRLHPEVVIAMSQEQGQPRIEQALPGWMDYLCGRG